MSDFVPSAPKSLSLKPFTSGMVSNGDTGAKRIQGYTVEPTGLRRRSAWTPMFADKTAYGAILDLVEGERVQSLFPYWMEDGSFRYVALTNKSLYMLSDAEDTWLVPHFAQAGVLTTSLTTTLLTNTGETFLTKGMRLGDRLHYEVAGDLFAVDITEVTETTLAYATTANITSGTNFWVEHRFSLDDSADVVDYAIAPGYAVLVDNSIGGIVKFDGTIVELLGAHEALGDDADYLLGARTVMYFAGRIWLGGTIESTDNGNRRIRWSSLTDVTEFAQIDYIDFIGEKSNVLKLVASEDVPVVALESALFTGYASSLEGLPYAFIRVESGTVSFAGAHAYASAGGGIFFTARDNFYFLATGRQGTSQTASCTALGLAIVDESVAQAPSFVRAQVVYSALNEQVWFVLPSTEGTIWRIFVFALRTKAWSYFDQPADMFVALTSVPSVRSGTSWDDLDALDWDDIASVTWASMEAHSLAEDTLAFDVNGVAYGRDDSLRDDVLVDTSALVNRAISTTIESNEMTFDAPDVDKVLTRVALHVRDLVGIDRDDAATFALAVSETRGRTFVAKGDIVIDADADADEAHFRFRAESVRVRLACAQTPPIELTDIVLRLRGGDLHNVRD